MPTQPTPSWAKLKSRLSALDKDMLLALLRDLYALNADNKVFLTTRFLAATPEELTAPYRRVVRQVFNPDRGVPSLQLGAARKALNDFRKACADPRQVIDFMLFYVEQGVICTNSYGDIDAPFYDSLLAAYRNAAQLVAGIKDPDLIEPFQPRFQKIISNTRNIGWGFHDGLIDIYTGVLPTYWEL
ncbi:MAG: hypothetical protein QG637_1683 [Chloroflexota bacterium]|nr:hypothetical protein [Chloroflexota bacterium]